MRQYKIKRDMTFADNMRYTLTIARKKEKT